MTGRRESAVQSGIIAYLSTRKDILFWRKNVGATKYDNAYVKFGEPGEADIQGVQAPGARMFGIEAKREIGGKLSEAQRIWGENLTNFGGLYVVATNVKIVQEALGPELVRIQKIPIHRRVYPR